MTPQRRIPPGRRGHRLNVDLYEDEARSLRQAKADDGIPASYRVRALIARWRADADLRQAVDQAAAEMYDYDLQHRHKRGDRPPQTP